MVATLVAGLRENSRLVMKTNEVKASRNTVLLATIADRLGILYAKLLGTDVPDSIVESLLDMAEKDEQKTDNVLFHTPEEFMAAYYGE